jgi:hypothetical protein
MIDMLELGLCFYLTIGLWLKRDLLLNPLKSSLSFDFFYLNQLLEIFFFLGENEMRWFIAEVPDLR